MAVTLASRQGMSLYAYCKCSSCSTISRLWEQACGVLQPAVVCFSCSPFSSHCRPLFTHSVQCSELTCTMQQHSAAVLEKTTKQFCWCCPTHPTCARTMGCSVEIWNRRMQDCSADYLFCTFKLLAHLLVCLIIHPQALPAAVAGDLAPHAQHHLQRSRAQHTTPAMKHSTASQQRGTA